jgi:hypothetical protein
MSEELGELLFVWAGVEPVGVSDFESPGEMIGELVEGGFEDVGFGGREVGWELEEGGAE